MSLVDGFEWLLGFQIGCEATNAVSDMYRAKGFDPAVRKDLTDLLAKGRLDNIAYPFPTKETPPKKPIFVLRHKVFSLSFVVFMIVMYIAGKASIGQPNFDSVVMGICIAFLLFWFCCVAVMLVKKLLRGGKKASDFVFQTQYIYEGKQYWNVREYVRQALDMGQLDLQGAYVRLRGTELGRQLPDSDTEIEARVFNSRRG